MIRGGAIGDFILTLPALKALRDAYPGSHIEILGYTHIAALAKGRFYADAVRSIEYGPLSRFFARSADLPRDLSDYFAGFDLIVTYLFDPDLIFQTNVERAGVSAIITGPGKLTEDGHAARQLARPMIIDLELELKTTSAAIYLSHEDRAFAAEFLRDLPDPIIALHPGSGSERKNWPLRKWIELGNKLLNLPNLECSLLVISGEADEAQASGLQSQWKNSRVRFARNLPLTHLAAVSKEPFSSGTTAAFRIWPQRWVQSAFYFLDQRIRTCGLPLIPASASCADRVEILTRSGSMRCWALSPKRRCDITALSRVAHSSRVPGDVVSTSRTLNEDFPHLGLRAPS